MNPSRKVTSLGFACIQPQLRCLEWTTPWIQNVYAIYTGGHEIIKMGVSNQP